MENDKGTGIVCERCWVVYAHVFLPGTPAKPCQVAPGWMQTNGIVTCPECSEKGARAADELRAFMRTGLRTEIPDHAPTKEAPSMPKPTIGRIVHYTNLGDKDGKFPPEIQAAIVTGVDIGNDGEPTAWIPSVSLLVIYKTGLFHMDHVGFTTEPAGTDGARGKWSWPQVSVAGR